MNELDPLQPALYQSTAQRMPAGPFPSSPTGSSTSSFEAWVGDDDDETVEDPESGQPLHRLISHDELHERARRLARVARMRWVMLGAACCLSVGR